MKMMRESGPTAADDFEDRIESLLVPTGRYAYSILMSREDAEDAIQEAALKAYVSLDRYDPSRSFKGWWFAIVRNCCLDAFRKRKREGVVEPVTDSVLSQVTTDPHQEIAQRDALVQALARLNPEHKEIIQLRYFGECSYREVAATLGIPIGTVMSRVHSARRALAKEYKEVEK
jgi:RNA polymerase sigma-70 factor (ECF subfamily)